MASANWRFVCSGTKDWHMHDSCLLFFQVHQWRWKYYGWFGYMMLLLYINRCLFVSSKSIDFSHGTSGWRREWWNTLTFIVSVIEPETTTPFCSFKITSRPLFSAFLPISNHSCQKIRAISSTSSQGIGPPLKIMEPIQ